MELKITSELQFRRLHRYLQRTVLRCESIFNYQRSRPIPNGRGPAEAVLLFILFLVGLGGVEPPTSRLSGVRSNQLSYSPL
jgi:hypothetical protein